MPAWPTTPEALAAAQRELAGARPAPWSPPDEHPAVAGCFVCFPRDTEGRAGERAWAAAAFATGPAGVVEGVAGAPYAPGLMALREGPLLEAAVRALPAAPGVLVVNATGRDHPRGAGLALHLGAVLDLPSVGVTDRPLTGLVRDGAEAARLVRTRADARPLVVHPGWRTDLDTAVAVVLSATRGARTPEPLRRAREAARRARTLSPGG